MSQGSEQRIRTERRTVRFTPSEAASVDAEAERAGLMFGSYVRLALLGARSTRQVRRPPVERRELARLLGELGHVGANLNQLAHHANVGRPITRRDITDALDKLAVVRDAILAALGRA
jgi:hypothetical protein